MSDQTNWLQKKEPFTVVEPADPSEWDEFATLWGGGGNDTLPLKSILKSVRASGARTVVVENAYPDLDQASEAAYWPHEFALPHIDVYRAHFFSSEISVDFPLKQQDGYLGYAVVARPLGRLIRALIQPPPCLSGLSLGEEAFTCQHCDRLFSGALQGCVTSASELVELFGVEYKLEGVPYCGQDAWHLQCGHAAAWTCLFCAFLQNRAPRTTLRDAVEAGASAEVDAQRAVSATGTNFFQLQRIFTTRGMPALYYQMSHVVKDDRLDLSSVRRRSDLSESTQAILSIVCNYLNSGFPVVASTSEHTVTLIGWRRTEAPDGEIELVYSDADEIFGTVYASQLEEEKWQHLMIPLPPDVVLTGETAQAEAYRALEKLKDFLIDSDGPEIKSLAQTRIEEIETLLEQEQISLRLQLKRRHDYRSAVRGQVDSRGAEVGNALAVLRLPGWVWVVEVQDREARESGEDCVVAEFVFDTTSPDDAPQPAAVSVGGLVWCNWPYDSRSIPARTVAGSLNGSSPAFRWSSQINSAMALDVPDAALQVAGRHH